MMTLEKALNKAKDELAVASYWSEVAPNAGLKTIYSNRVEYLTTLIYATEMYYRLLQSGNCLSA